MWKADKTVDPEATAIIIPVRNIYKLSKKPTDMGNSVHRIPYKHASLDSGLFAINHWVTAA
jgi:hypothetical protein